MAERFWFLPSCMISTGFEPKPRRGREESSTLAADGAFLGLAKMAGVHVHGTVSETWSRSTHAGRSRASGGPLDLNVGPLRPTDER